jgi:hypothetical protein
MFNWTKNPKVRFYGAVVLFFASILGGIHSVVFVAKTPYDRILIGISWLAITITAVDVMATTDVRKEQDK